MGCGPPPPPVMADTADATPETIPPTSAAGGDSTDSAPPAPLAKPPSAEPRISPKPRFCAGVAAAGVMIRVSIPSSSPGRGDPETARSQRVPGGGERTEEPGGSGTRDG